MIINTTRVAAEASHARGRGFGLAKVGSIRVHKETAKDIHIEAQSVNGNMLALLCLAIEDASALRDALTVQLTTPLMSS